jgi:hypothetical protein
LTDPPVMPAGVTAINIEYDSLAIHSAGSSQAQGWVPLNSSGRIDLLGTVNRSQTIAVTQIRSGAYDQLRLVINSSVLTFNGRNYTAFVSTGALSFPIEGRFEVNGSQSAATIINFNPTVLNIGSAAVPQFLMQADAAAYPVPPTAVSPSMTSVGARTSLTGMTWWRSVQSEFSRSIKITSVRLSNSGLSFTLQSTGSQASNLKIVMVTPVNMQASVSAAASPVFQGSAVFVLQPDGSLHRVPSNTSLVGPSTLPFIQLFQSAGYLLPAAGTFTSSYSGSLQGVVSGHAYEVIVMGDGVAAVYIVQAS